MPVTFIGCEAALRQQLGADLSASFDKLRFAANIQEWQQQRGAQDDRSPIVVSDQIFNDSSSEFMAGMEQIQELAPHSQLIVILSDRGSGRRNEQALKCCLAGGWAYTPPGFSAQRQSEAVAELLQVQLHGAELPSRAAGAGKLIVFLGSTPNIGTTVAAYGIAQRLAIETNQSVAYICLNLKSSRLHRYLGVEHPNSSLDGIRAELRSRTLTVERFKSCCYRNKQLPRLHVLFGNLLRDQAEYFLPADFEHLLEIARQSADMCIVEAGAYWDNAATLTAVRQPAMKIVVTTCDIGAFQEDMNRWIAQTAPLFDVDPADFDLFVTQTSAHDRSYSIRQIRKETNLPVIGSMRYFNQIGAFLNEGRLYELFTHQQPVIECLGGIIRMIVALYGLNKAGGGTQKRMWHRKKWLSKEAEA